MDRAELKTIFKNPDRPNIYQQLRVLGEALDAGSDFINTVGLNFKKDKLTILGLFEISRKFSKKFSKVGRFGNRHPTTPA